MLSHKKIKPSSRKPSHPSSKRKPVKSIGDQRRDEITKSLLAKMESSTAPKDQYRVQLYRHLSRFPQSGMLTDNQRFFFLACQCLKMVDRCPNDGYEEFKWRRFCRREFWCLDCAAWKTTSRAMQWERNVKSALLMTNLFLGPMLTLAWDIPESGPGTGSGLDHLKRFHKYLEQTWPAKLETLGIGSGNRREGELAQWLLFTSFDPILHKIRGLYFGPPLSTRALSAYIYSTNAKSALVPRGGQPSPWTPKKGKEVYLLDEEKSPVKAASKFFERIRTGIDWTLGSPHALLELEPKRAFELDSQYGHRHLTSARGAVYGLNEAAAFIEGDTPIQTELNVLKLCADGNVDLVSVDPVKLIGSVQTTQTAPKTDAGSLSGDDFQSGVCGTCGGPLDRTCVPVEPSGTS
ncbi:MAG TPA: hypothetical protein VN861_02955 [Candidatus Acidoferrales bacterium]|nr:hypothetical protein [Candidatus Acidoferrales bacterium]